MRGILKKTRSDTALPVSRPVSDSLSLGFLKFHVRTHLAFTAPTPVTIGAAFGELPVIDITTLAL